MVPLTLSLVLAVVGAFLATQLELKTRFDQLLPDHQPSVVELRRVLEKTDTGSNIFVVLEGDDVAELRALGDALVPRLRAIGPPWVASAEDGVQGPRAFLSPRSGLFATTPELKKLRDDIQSRWDWEVRQKIDEWNLDPDAPPPPPVTAAEIKKRFTRGKESTTERFPDGYYQPPDKKALIVIAHASITSGELDRSREALARVKAVVEDVHAAPEFRGVRASYAGDLVTALAEYGAVKDDLVSVGAIGIALVLGVVFLFFMRVRALIAMGLTIACGIAWTFGLTRLAIGHLNVATGFLFSIVAGNGINFGIIYMARYFEERRSGKEPEEAVLLAHKGTWPATLTAALSAAAAYGSLGATDFRAFKHFAFIGSVGMIVCWIATCVMLPAVLVLCDRVHPFTGGRAPRSWFARVRLRGLRYDAPFAFIVPRAPRVIAAVGLALALGGAFAFVRYVRSDPMEYNMRRLQNDLGTSAELYRVATVAGDTLGTRVESSIVVLCDRLDQVEPLRRVLEARRDAAPPDEKPFEAAHTLLEFVPPDQAEKLPVLQQIRTKVMRAREYGHIADADWPEIERMLPPANLQPFGVSDLPDDLARPFTERDGTRGRIVLIEPTFGKNDTDLHYLLRLADSLRETTLPNGEIVRGSGRAVIFADMLKAIVGDMPRAVALSLGMTMIAVVLLTFRRGANLVAVLFSLAVGLSWLVLYVASTHVKINFFNFIAFPITFGIGVDYAINFVQRYGADPRGGILGVLRTTGGAVILCSLTTTLGYLALLGSLNQAIRSLGLVAVMGEVCCLLAAVLVLPAMLLLRERKRRAAMGTESTAE